ncbi:MAG: shikimate dehydrogenase [Fluviicoccus sp.]|uniref:shikimate dehydrogenase n=1 Tax=Fluviicoccus sp. TaxID=2003552 RepID=UPI00271F43CD|nr:shikimate dehydrogenase [Fluviicoccus sp.]MDO8331111.1 shikimate dehydrogenase [Fluviicoccus sp.]
MTDRYAVIGNPIAHSRSPIIHRTFAEQTGQDLSYEALLGPLDSFTPFVTQFFADGGRGLNVTLPFKEQAYALSEVLSKRARQAGAVNTLMRGKDDRIYGDNTDGIGIVRDMTQNHGWTLEGKRVLIIGAGGAVRGVIGPLLAAGIASLHIVNRTPEKAETLADLFKGDGDVAAARYEDIPAGSVDILINGSSASLSGELPPVPAGILAECACAYDMAYGKGELPFMAWARAQGAAQVSDGLGMLVEQAAESFYIWRHVRPETAPVLAMMRELVAKG